MLLGDTVAKVYTSPRNSTWFSRLFLLVRGWGLRARLEEDTVENGENLLWFTVQTSSMNRLTRMHKTRANNFSGIFPTYLGKVCDSLWDSVLQLVLDGSRPHQSEALFYLVVHL